MRDVYDVSCIGSDEAITPRLHHFCYWRERERERERERLMLVCYLMNCHDGTKFDLYSNTQKAHKLHYTLIQRPACLGIARTEMTNCIHKLHNTHTHTHTHTRRRPYSLGLVPRATTENYT